MRSKLFLALSLLGFSNCASVEAQQMCQCPCPSVSPSPSPSLAPSPSPSPSIIPSPTPAPANGCNGPRAAGKPGPNNTGPCNASILKPSGSITASTANQIIENVAIKGTVTIKAHNVILRNFTIDAQGSDYGINVVGGTSDLSGVSATIQDGEIKNANQAAIFGQDWTSKNLHVHEMGSDAFKGGWNTQLIASWIHNIGSAPLAHADGFQSVNGQNVVISGNFFNTPSRTNVGSTAYKVNSCIFMNIDPSKATIANVMISNNWLIGGNFALFSSGPTNVSVLNNIFGLVNGNDLSVGEQFGFVYGGTKTLKVWSGNKDVNGKPI